MLALHISLTGIVPCVIHELKVVVALINFIMICSITPILDVKSKGSLQTSEEQATDEPIEDSELNLTPCLKSLGCINYKEDRLKVSSRRLEKNNSETIRKGKLKSTITFFY